MAFAKFSPPEQFDFRKPEAWPDWKQRFARYRVASLLAENDEVVQVNALIYSMGAEAEHIFKSFTFAAVGDSYKYNVVMAKFDEILSRSATLSMNVLISIHESNFLEKVWKHSSGSFMS